MKTEDLLTPSLMFSHFFIERPIFASVLSIVITLAGGVAVFTLPVGLYPQITPPSIIVMCTYPGANAQVVADSVAAPIEQQVNGVQDMIYMSSQSANDGSYQLSVTFKPGVDMNFAQVLVQNRVSLALPLLPDVVKQAGVTTRKRNPDILLIVSMISPKGRYDQLYLSNFATIRVKDELARVEGVGDVFIFGQQDYSMRIWLDPDKMSNLNLSASDVVSALREQNKQVAAGHIGQPPTRAGLPVELTITTLGRLKEAEQFDDIVVKASADGKLIRIKDVGRVVIGARAEDVTSRLDGYPNASLAVFQLPSANALDTADRVKARMQELQKTFPEDVEFRIAFDTTPFIRESINEVFHTLGEAIVLVALVVLLFLQNWRSTIIPLVAVPVAIIGTFAAMAAIGFSLNNLTLFGLVLAIGIVVDDAIVVVEAVEHHIEEGMSPRRAAHQAMREVSGPVIAVALVLSAVFVPCAFISGITGQFFRQFALTIAVSTLISAFNSLTLSPALAAILLPSRKQAASRSALPSMLVVLLGGGLFWALLGRPWSIRLEPLLAHLEPWMSAGGPWVRPVAAIVLGVLIGWLVARPFNAALRGFFKGFNWGFSHTVHGYTRAVGMALRGSGIVLVVYGGFIVLTWWTSRQLPTGYIPTADQGKLYVAVQMPDATALERTQKIIDRVADIVANTEGILHTTEIAGQSFTLGANGPNFGNLFCSLDDFDVRRDKARQTWYRITDETLAALRDADVSEDALERLKPLRNREFLEERLRREIASEVGAQADEELEDLTLEHAQRLRGLDMSSDAIAARIKRDLAELVPEAITSVFGPPPVAGLGSSGGFKVILEDRGGGGGGSKGLAALQTQTEHLIAASKPNPSSAATLQYDAPQQKVRDLFTVFRANTPQLYIDLNRDQCETMGVNPADVFATLQIYLGSFYVNDFNRFGRTWQVVVQARGQYRNDAAKVKLLKVRNAQGDMVPLGSVLSVRDKGGPIILNRYNMYPAAIIVGNTRSKVSTGEGIDAMERLCRQEISEGFDFEWTEINYIQIDASKNIWNNLIFPLSVVFVFLVLAAQYESWALPLAVILVVPMCILGSLIGVYATNSDINIFTQIGFVVLVGLASKNAILIVEFAKHKHEEGGLSRREATLEACRLRLRPILMTSFAFILGVVPLLTATGAGAEMRRTLGTAVFSGMLGVTLFGIFLTPVFFFVIEGMMESSWLATTGHWLRGAWRRGVGIFGLGLPVEPAVAGPAHPALFSLDGSVNGERDGNGAPRRGSEPAAAEGPRRDTEA